MNQPLIQEENQPSISIEAQQFRSQMGHISRNSSVYFVGTIFSIVLGYGFKVYLARVLGAEVLGIYALGITLTGFVGVFNSLGLTESAVRFAAKYRASSQIKELRSLLWRGGLALLLANLGFGFLLLEIGPIIALRFYHSAGLAQYLPWFAALMVLGIISTFYSRVLAGYKQVGRRTIIANFIGSPATMLFSIALITMGLGLSGYLEAQLAGGGLVLGLVLIYVWKLTPDGARLDFRFPAPLPAEVWSFSLATIGIMLVEFVVGQSDKVVLGYYCGVREVGIYSIAAAIVAYTNLFLISVNQVFSPIIADLHTRGDSAMLERLYKALTKWVLALTLPLALTVMVDAKSLLRTFGPDFEQGWPVLIIGILGQLISCGVGSVGLLLWMSGNEKRLLRVQTIMAAIMLLTSVALVPRWGIVGAALASAITNIGTNAWNLREVHQNLGLSPFGKGYFRLALAAAVTLGVIFLISGTSLWLPNWLKLAVSLGASYAVFFAVTMLLGLDEDDRLIIGAIRSKFTSLVAA